MPLLSRHKRVWCHNQRVDVTVSWQGDLWIEDVIALVESSASQPLYPLLKRPDEKYVTEKLI